MQTIDGDVPEAVPAAPAAKKGGWPAGKKRGPRRAEMRTEQRDVQRDGQRTSTAWPKRVSSDPSNRYYVNPSSIPKGMDYQWNVQTVMGEPAKEQMIAMEMAGWRPVPAERHPELAGRAAKGDEQILRAGQVLMERPMEYTLEARAEDARRANSQINDKLHQLGLAPDGHLGKNGRRNVTARRDYNLAVPEDAE